MSPLAEFDPLVRDWFTRRFAQVTEPQTLGWPEIRAGHDVLISAPTGSGKTLAAFLLCLDRLVRAARRGPLPNQTEVVYVSPLKALSNDIRINLEIPLSEIAAQAAEQGIALAPIRTAVRTGDTPAWERQQMGRDRPHVLVTTPESLFILMTAERPRDMLRTTRTVIVDEIHAVADDKRGSHLALTLARLDALTASAGGPKPQRIGLSATVKPIEEVARYLSETARIVNVGHRRDMELVVETPRDELGPVASNEMWAEIYDRVAELIRARRTTLVFVNTRRLSERVAHHLQERLGEQAVLPHHGSLSRRLRLEAEARLKGGALRAVVATASLELGIDIGTVDLVCQIGTPRSIAVALQRIGRSGHWVGARPEGRIFATTRDELIECAALVRAIRSGALDRTEIPASPLDILAQQIVAACACEEWTEDGLFALARSTYSYGTLDRRDFDDIVAMLSDGIVTARGRAGAYLHRDQVNHRLRGRRGARLAAITSGGAIPDNANYLVVAEPEGATVGTVDEDFAVESMAGDVFLLGNTSWRIRRVENGRVRVEDAKGAAPSIPFWNGEAPGRTAELSAEVSRLRADVLAEPEIEWLLREAGLDRLGAEQAIAYVQSGARALGVLPASTHVVAERFFDEGGGMQFVLHAPFGARINRAWGLALRKRFCRKFNFELQAAATDNGIVLSLGEQHSFPLDIVFEFLRPETVEDVLTQALLAAPMFGARWRWNASRALAILRFAHGAKVPAPIQRMRADDLLAATFPDQAACAENLTGPPRIPDHPLVRETIRNCLHEAMDLTGLIAVLEGIRNGAVRTTAIDTPEATPFSHEILNANPYAFLDDAPLEERRARAVQLRRTVRTDFVEGAGALDAEAIAQVAAEAWPLVRDADELHEALLTLVTVPPAAEWEPFFGALVEARRAAVLSTPVGVLLWTPAERCQLARAVHADATLTPPIDFPGSAPETEEGCAAEILRGWFESGGPYRAAELAGRLALPRALVDAALAQLEAEGQILRGRFHPDAASGEHAQDGATRAAESKEFLARMAARQNAPLCASGEQAQDGATRAAESKEFLACMAARQNAPLCAKDEPEWCHRRLLARIHRLTIGRLRREIEPVSTADFERFVDRWQHVAPGAQLHGADGVLHVIRQMQGYEISAAAWEDEILPGRVANYKPEHLDQLCLSGEVMWGRLSPHPAFETEADGRTHRVRPTRVAPLTLFLREDAEWLLAGPQPAPDTALSHPAREVLGALQQHGASFFPELARLTGRLASEVEDALWELVAAGLVTADGFENLRALLDPKRRRGEGRGRTARPRHAAGRWALLRRSAAAHAEISPASFARQLLRRWGVVFRDLAHRETLAPPWRAVLVELRRMEARGEIRGGRFADAFLGEQFALPEALDLLRAVRREGAGREAPQSLAGAMPGM
ncbi:MAG TPA: DEAD/DEAH box helicase [Bryobacteraceae bacterium]|nr:DEAD/DEAH box helicase [Bryobacteraceae bacterium]